jgi:single-strand DNA-binding protein
MALYENSIRLKGFTGKEAQTRILNNGKSFTVLSLATQSSYKDQKTGQWVAHTEWHRVVCFGKAAQYAKELKRGDYVEVAGELRSSEFESQQSKADGENASGKRRSWEVRAATVRKLARPENPDAEPAPESDAA